MLDDVRLLAHSTSRYLELSRFNHSCLPNCGVSWDDREGHLHKGFGTAFWSIVCTKTPKADGVLDHVGDLAGKHVLLAASFLPCVCVQECFKYMLSGTLGEIVSFERATRGVAMF